MVHLPLSRSRSGRRAVPDLSRYQQFYEADAADGYSTGSGLSSAAASVASLRRPGVGMGRTQSLTGYGRTRSLGAARPSYLGAPPRTYSMSSQRRANSLRSNNGFGPPAVAAGNTITVKTTETKDLQGRTRTVTRQTVKHINGVRYVETTTTMTMPDGEYPDDFYGFEGDFTAKQTSSGHVYQNARGAPDISDIAEEESLEEYLDARDTAPALRIQLRAPPRVQQQRQLQRQRRLSDTNFPARRSAKSSPARQSSEEPPATTKPHRIRFDETPQIVGIDPPTQKKAPKKQMTEQEMYMHALDAARKKVYGEISQPALEAKQPHRSTMSKRMTLRDEATLAANTPPERSRPAKREVRKKEGHSHHNFLSVLRRDSSPKRHAVQPSERVHNKEKTLEMTPDSSSASSYEEARFEHSDEMYNKALEVAKKKYHLTQENSTRDNGTTECPRTPMTSLMSTNVSSDTAESTLLGTPVYSSNAPFDRSPQPSSGCETGNTTPKSIPRRPSFLDKLVRFSQEKYGYRPRRSISSQGHKAEHEHVFTDDIPPLPDIPLVDPMQVKPKDVPLPTVEPALGPTDVSPARVADPESNIETPRTLAPARSSISSSPRRSSPPQAFQELVPLQSTQSETTGDLADALALGDNSLDLLPGRVSEISPKTSFEHFVLAPEVPETDEKPAAAPAVAAEAPLSNPPSVVVVPSATSSVPAAQGAAPGVAVTEGPSLGGPAAPVRALHATKTAAAPAKKRSFFHKLFKKY
ncbi:AGR185Cp [Eremothecium gossypii ATCC 10895]|uniref:Meiotic sister-chromatid recombination protein 3 n=1 Tax=Eremothecium gossypii (strain ATCC 10895 / CBS 109.51 / FGSC 9923 / NRRL Y-1056) TaxID=284811 RepID=MSC3_EREGS|nr:AGR185Cp [Eremothecium gossypii ATCC 10895]Q74ZL3.1 RecName: Full=Meiotic sister-chromatid recombination protein 3 [Eremothecium gossypii ATCC 10895]AAS54675.1 AGR185Cp [Eremothecium gossypii ATCC 10895]AEY99005.1 FAGR185Cp [Eremothecium gossypii FDAG1]